MELKEAYKQCEAVIKEHSKTFYKAFSLLPKNEREAVYSIYAFCRTVDDIVDEGLYPEQELMVFEQDFERYIVQQEKTTHHMWYSLQDVFMRYEMDVEPFREMIQGQKMDLNHHHFQSIEDVLSYGYYVASTVGLMLLPVIAPHTKEQLRNDAIALGQALQITNILRDIDEDYKRQRIYLPREVMNRYGYTEEMLEQGIVNEAFISLWEELASVAETLYAQALQSINLYPLKSRIPVKGALYLYKEILQQIKENQYGVFERKHYVSYARKREIMKHVM